MSALPREKPRASPSPFDAVAHLFEVRETKIGRGLFACQPIARGTPVFSEDDWVDETEARAFSVLTVAQLEKLSPALRSDFVRYGYNIALDQVSGTFHPEAVRHPVNFINHSCDPNLGYDGMDAIIALCGISPGEEIRMDYGSYSFSFDHEFTCTCGAWGCRGKVQRDDWKSLVRMGLRLPGFMRAEVDRLLWG
ncbi:MAG: SET domain-containing protein [Alphaproteobacteria bacterium]